MIRALSIASVLSFAVSSMGAAFAQDHAPAPAAPATEQKPSLAEGFNLHVMAPHKFELLMGATGTVSGETYQVIDVTDGGIIQGAANWKGEAPDLPEIQP